MKNWKSENFATAAFTSIAGGVPLLVNGNSAGGIGVSGRKIEEDEELASQFAQMLTSEVVYCFKLDLTMAPF